MIPPYSQGLLWSRDKDQLDLQKDKVYIIHQVLAFGSLEDIKTLFQFYPKKEVQSVFQNHPKKIYHPPVFHFVKNFLLDLKSKALDSKQYVKISLGDSWRASTKGTPIA